jgi:hypothetical protein
MKNIVSLIFLFSASIGLFAQQSGPKFAFDKMEHNFGTIKEDKGSVSYRFEFSNSGNAPIIITNVKASCGCTTPKWTREPVLPGTKGFIDVAYNPKNRPGPFSKSITITSNAVTPTTILRISGNVERGQQSIEQVYRYAVGDLRIKTNHLAFGNVPKGQTRSKSIEMINNGSTPMEVSFINVPEHVKITSNPVKLEPKQKGTINVEYNSELLNEWDFVIHRVNIQVNGSQPSNNRLSISSTLIEDFSKLTDEQMKNAPKAFFANKTFDFGTITDKEEPEHVFIIGNHGKSDLIIRKIKASCGCTAVAPEKDIIKPGESAEIKTVFNPKGKKGSVRKSITVITNDPINYKSILWVKGQVNPSN